MADINQSADANLKKRKTFDKSFESLIEKKLYYNFLNDATFFSLSILELSICMQIGSKSFVFMFHSCKSGRFVWINQIFFFLKSQSKSSIPFILKEV